MRRLTCSKCPKWANNWCPRKAEPCVPAHPMCDEGRRFRHNEISAEWMRRRHGSKKRAPKAAPQNHTTT